MDDDDDVVPSSPSDGVVPSISLTDDVVPSFTPTDGVVPSFSPNDEEFPSFSSNDNLFASFSTDTVFASMPTPEDAGASSSPTDDASASFSAYSPTDAAGASFSAYSPTDAAGASFSAYSPTDAAGASSSPIDATSSWPTDAAGASWPTDDAGASSPPADESQNIKESSESSVAQVGFGGHNTVEELWSLLGLTVSDSDEDTDPAVIAEEVNNDKKRKKPMSTDVSDDSHSNDDTEVVEPLKGAPIEEPDHPIVADTVNRYKNFPRFDIVQGCSDHHFAEANTSRQLRTNWSKRIHEEWKMLQNNLPDTIFVRVYEERMDLMRTVILGVQGTPYHDGLFFFDIWFSPHYPDSPPEVYFHSHGLELNPVLYDTGDVCLSLLSLWGSEDETQNWRPELSNMLQLLLSIQALVLNAEPFFNSPALESFQGTIAGQKYSLRYNEDVFIQSLKAMSDTMRKPPKHFEEFVSGHFLTHAKDILETCKAYVDGAQVGTIVKGGGGGQGGEVNFCSEGFRNSLCSSLPLLGKSFTGLGLEGIDKW